MVKDKSENNGWEIVSERQSLFQKPTNYFFRKEENINFDNVNSVILFKGKKYSLNEFIDLLEKNHLRDMFLWGRIWSFVKKGLLHVLFFLADSGFEITDYFIKMENGKSETTLKDSNDKIREKTDPFLHYFNIYKNFLGSIIAILLVLIFWKLPELDSNLLFKNFTISNPFILFFLFLILYVLDILSGHLYHLLAKTDFVRKRVLSLFSFRAHLKKY